MFYLRIRNSLKVVIVTSDVSGNVSKSLTGNNGAMHNFNLRGDSSESKPKS